MTEKIQKLLSDSKSARWAALALISFTMLAAYYFVDMIAPLESLLESPTGNYRWTPSNYGFFSGSEYMLNVFLGFLIISGIILDKMGIRFTGLLATVVMLTGGMIKLYALSPMFYNGGFGYDFFNSFWPAMPATAKLAAMGYGIFGIGVEMAGITTSRTVVKWFKGKELALAMGMQLATARLGASVAFFFSADIAGLNDANGVVTGYVLNPVYLGVSLLCVGFLTFLIYTLMDRKLDKQTGHAGPGADPTEEFHLKDLGKIITNRGFLIISLLCVLFYSGVFPFLKYAVMMMQAKLGVDASIAGKISGLLPVGTILLTPIIGLFLDRKGKGATIMIFGALLMTVAHLTFAFMPNSIFLAITAIIILGIAFSLVPASMWPSVPKIVEERYLGSAYALVFFIQNIGLMFFPWLIGVVIEWFNPENVALENRNYTASMLVFAALGVAAIFLGFLLRAEDKRKQYGLELPNKRS